MTDRPLKAVGSFIFAGGFTLGVQEHFDVLAHLEGNGHGHESARENFPDLPIHIGPETWPTDELAEAGVDFVFCNPPCAAWSQANAKSSTHWRGDGRVDCTRTCFTLLEKLRPRVWVWESVRGAFTTGRQFVNELAEQARNLGYAVTFLYVDAVKHGVPQRRRRFFFVAHDVTLDFDMDDPDKDGVTVRDALEGATLLKQTCGKLNKEAKWYSLIDQLKPGEEAHRLFNAEFQDYVHECERQGLPRVPGRPSFQVRRAPWDDACFTFTGGATILHPEANRFLSVEEYALLSGYPTSFKFVGGTDYQYKQVAQAVLPPVGEYLAREVAKGIRRGEPAHPGDVRFVDVSGKERVERWVSGGPVPLDPREMMGMDDPPPSVTPRPSRPRGTRQGPRRRKVPVDQVAIPEAPGPDDLADGPHRTSGSYIRALLRGNHDGRWRLADEQIAALVRHHFEGRTTDVGDVYWNRKRLHRDEGYLVKRLPLNEESGEKDDG